MFLWWMRLGRGVSGFGAAAAGVAVCLAIGTTYWIVSMNSVIGPPDTSGPTARQFLAALANRDTSAASNLMCPGRADSPTTGVAALIAQGIPGRFTAVPGYVSYATTGEIDWNYKFYVTENEPPMKATVDLLPTSSGYCVAFVDLHARYRG